MVWAVVLFIVGFIIIIKGGDWFIEAAVWVAEVTGVPKLLIGATVVSLATTMPEFFVSVLAVADGAAGLGIGNAIGSVICNTGLILALFIIIRPSTVDQNLFYKKAGLMALSLVVLFLTSMDGTLSALESIPLFMIFGAFLYLNIHHVRRCRLDDEKTVRHIDTHKKTITINVLKFIAGAAGIVGGAQLLVDNGTVIAQSLGVSDGVIGVSIVAVGTSLPELVTTITALRKKESALGIGNILGANILNFTLILSTCALISDGGLRFQNDTLSMFSEAIPRSLYVDMPVVALLFLLLVVPAALFKGRLKRFAGISMMIVYVAFIAFLIVNL